MNADLIMFTVGLVIRIKRELACVMPRHGTVGETKEEIRKTMTVPDGWRPTRTLGLPTAGRHSSRMESVETSLWQSFLTVRMDKHKLILFILMSTSVQGRLELWRILASSSALDPNLLDRHLCNHRTDLLEYRHNRVALDVSLPIDWNMNGVDNGQTDKVCLEIHPGWPRVRFAIRQRIFLA
jgi:hypothetical protein